MWRLYNEYYRQIVGNVGTNACNVNGGWFVDRSGKYLYGFTGYTLNKWPLKNNEQAGSGNFMVKSRNNPNGSFYTSNLQVENKNGSVWVPYEPIIKALGMYSEVNGNKLLVYTESGLPVEVELANNTVSIDDLMAAVNSVTGNSFNYSYDSDLNILYVDQKLIN